MEVRISQNWLWQQANPVKAARRRLVRAGLTPDRAYTCEHQGQYLVFNWDDGSTEMAKVDASGNFNGSE